MALGKWNITLKAMGQEKEGVVDLDNKVATAMDTNFPVENLVEDGNKVAFDLVNQGKAIKFNVVINGDTFEGKAKFGPLPMAVTGKKAD